MRQHRPNNNIYIKNLEEKLELNADLSVSYHEGDISTHYPKQSFRSKSYSLILLIKGKLNLSVNFNKETLVERDIFFVFPDSIYEIVAEQEVSFLRVYFNKNYLKQQGIFFSSVHTYKLFIARSINKFSLSKDEYADIYSNILSLQKRLKISKEIPHASDIIRNSFVEILYDLFLIDNKRTTFLPIWYDSKAELTTRFLNLLSENFRKEKRIIYYANELCITPRHLSQVVKQVTDRTAGEIIDDMVIGEAKILLTSHLFNISEIAAVLSFSDSSFFGKYFKKQTGSTPSEYKLANHITHPTPF